MKHKRTVRDPAKIRRRSRKFLYVNSVLTMVRNQGGHIGVVLQSSFIVCVGNRGRRTWRWKHISRGGRGIGSNGGQEASCWAGSAVCEFYHQENCETIRNARTIENLLSGRNNGSHSRERKRLSRWEYTNLASETML